ncbi:MAG: hypothetical protein GY757_06600 [bacterium]|nr:hypothetical protein [bacterium]
MMTKKKLLIRLSLVLFVLVSFGLNTFGEEFSIDLAKKVDRKLKRIAKKRKRKSVFLKKVTFTQEELNSYLNIFYTKKYAPEVKNIKINLEKENHANGVLKIKLVGKKYEKVPSFLRDIEVEFSGKVECETYRMRYQFSKIKVNGKTFSPEMLDEAFSAAQVNARVKKSMYDWFDLLPGIKSVVLDYKKITLFY